jgi:hypothetical protein
MGNTFTVTVWRSVEKWVEGDGNYETYQYWQGESLIAAMWNTFKAKREYPNCVKFEWR